MESIVPNYSINLYSRKVVGVDLAKLSWGTI